MLNRFIALQLARPPLPGLWLVVRLLIVTISFTILTVPAIASVTAVVTHQGAEVEDAQFCLYRVAPAAPVSTPLDGKIRCYAAGELVDVPIDTFAVFGRRNPDLITAHHPLVFGSEEPKPGALRLGLSTVPSAQLHWGKDAATLGPDDHLAVIIGETSANRPSLMPLDPEMSLVPAEVPLVPLLVKGGHPVAAGPLLTLRPGEVAPTIFEPSDGATVLITFSADDPTPEPDGESPYSASFLRLLSRVEVPLVELIDSRGTSLQSQLNTIDSSNLFESVYVFRGVPPGPAKVRVSGRHWSPTVANVEVTDGPLMIAPPVSVEPGGAVNVSVALPPEIPEGHGDCEATAEENRGQPRVILYDCGDVSVPENPGRAFLRQCTSVVSRDLEEQSSPAEAAFEGLAAKDYVVATALGDTILNTGRATVETGKTSLLEMSLAASYVSGTVTHDGEPFAGTVRFVTGSSVTDPLTGYYYARLSSAPGSRTVQVVSCDESVAYLHKPEADVPNGPGYDLVIPSNEVLIDVFDEATGAKLAEATVAVLLVDRDDPSRGFGGVPAFAVDGDRYRSGNHPPGRTIIACAEKEGYRRACSEPLTIRRQTESVTVRLAPLHRKGRIQPAGGYSTAVWVRPDGDVSERASIDEKGEFYFALDHSFDHLILVGRAPLWVTREATAAPGETLELHPPTAPERSVTFRLGEQNPGRTATVLLWINGLPVPFEALVVHQQYRAQPWLIIKGAPVLVSGLFADDMIAAAEGPDPDLLQGLPNPGAAAFAGRQPTEVVGAEVVFP